MNNNRITNRIDELDTIRGFALLGIILVNILALYNTNVPEAKTINAGYQRFLYLFVEGRFYSIFSFLFGVGFYIFMTNAISKGKRAYALYLRRIGILFIFGVIHFLFQPGEALSVYAICGLLILPFYKVNKYINLVLSLLLLIYLSVLGEKILLTIPLIYLGLTVGQFKVFENLPKKKYIAYFTTIMLLLSLIGLYVQYKLLPDKPFMNYLVMNEDGTLDQTSQFLKMGIRIGPILSAFYIGLLLLLLQTKLFKKILSPLTYYGRMALTNYIGQTAMILGVGKLVHSTSSITYVQTLFICIAIYIIQIIFSIIWLRNFTMGPLEYIWRVLTYLQKIPLRRQIDHTIYQQNKIN